VLSTLFPPRPQAQELARNAIEPIGAHRASSAEDRDTAARQARRQACKQAIVRATERELYPELAATLVAPVLEAVCETRLKPGHPDDIWFIRAYTSEMDRKRGELGREANLFASEHVRAMYGEQDPPTLAQKRETIIATIAANDAQSDLSFPDIEALLEQDARHTAWLQWLLDGATPRQLDAGGVEPPARLGNIDEHAVSMIHDAIALTIAHSINALPRYADLERILADAMPQFETAQTTRDPSPQAATSALHPLCFQMRSGDLAFALEQLPGSNRVGVVRAPFPGN